MYSYTARVSSDDICFNKHQGNTASVAAYEKCLHSKAEMFETLKTLFRIYDTLTSHEIADILGISNRNKFAPRLSEMKNAGMLRETGELRNGCHALKLTAEYR